MDSESRDVRHGQLQAAVPSVLHCHGASVWRRGPFWELA